MTNYNKVKGGKVGTPLLPQNKVGKFLSRDGTGVLGQGSRKGHFSIRGEREKRINHRARESGVEKQVEGTLAEKRRNDREGRSN